jgi:hypothetical protein
MPAPKDPIKLAEWKRKQRLSKLGKKRPDLGDMQRGDRNPTKRPEVREKLSRIAKECQSGEKNGNFKGDAAGYAAIHYYVSRRKPKPDQCEICKESGKRLSLACVGEYTRDISQYKWLCWKCHRKIDHENPKRPEKTFTKKNDK